MYLNRETLIHLSNQYTIQGYLLKQNSFYHNLPF